VAAAPGSAESDVLASLAVLVDQHLLRREALPDGEPRFRLLETIREYAREQLAQAGDLPLVQYTYAAYWRDLAESAEAALRGPQQVAWLDRLARERANLNAALGWAEQADQVELGLRLAAARTRFRRATQTPFNRTFGARP
jgi:predicted ATPase